MLVVGFNYIAGCYKQSSCVCIDVGIIFFFLIFISIFLCIPFLNVLCLLMISSGRKGVLLFLVPYDTAV